MFDGIKEALYHQKKYGGKIYVIDEVEMEKYWEWRELDDDWTVETGEDGKPYFYTNMEVLVIQILITKLTMVKPTGVIEILITKYIRRKTQPINTTLSAHQERGS